MQDQTIIVHLYATSPTAACPQCGTAGSRVHSRYQRTIADVAFGGRKLILKLLVRKWICAEASCSRHIFAERFPQLVQRYARMTDRLIKALQSAGVITNGADAAQIASSFGVPTTAKTIIRRVLQLPVPSEGSVRKVGIDEWAWKKGQRYGTILVDLEKRRIVQLLAERSVQTSKAWLRKHPEIDLVSRDRGKLFREAATDGAPQAKQVVDRFHATRRTLPKPWRSSFASRSVCSKRRPVAAQAKHVLLKGLRYLKKSHRNVVLVIANACVFISGSGSCIEKDITKSRLPRSSESVRGVSIVPSNSKRLRLRAGGLAPLLSLIPTFPRLSSRWNQGCHNVARLYEEIVVQGYTGSRRTLELRLRPLRPEATRLVSKQTVILDKPPSPRGVALMMVRPQQSRTAEQTAYLDQLIQSNETVAVVFKLAQDFGHLLRKREGQMRLEQWKAAVQASGIAELITFVDGLDDDAEAVANGCTEPWSNGMVEGFINKVKWIKRSSYGQAGFPLLQRRVLLRPPSRKTPHPKNMLAA